MRGGTRKIRDIKALSQAAAGPSSESGDVIQMEEMGTYGYFQIVLFVSLTNFVSSLYWNLFFFFMLFFKCICHRLMFIIFILHASFKNYVLNKIVLHCP